MDKKETEPKRFDVAGPDERFAIFLAPQEPGALLPEVFGPASFGKLKQMESYAAQRLGLCHALAFFLTRQARTEPEILRALAGSEKTGRLLPEEEDFRAVLKCRREIVEAETGKTPCWWDPTFEGGPF